MKQTIVARSSTEAEYCALATIAELVWLRFLLKDMGISISTTTSIYCDNQSAIQSAQDDVSHGQTYHIEIDCHFGSVCFDVKYFSP